MASSKKPTPKKLPPAPNLNALIAGRAGDGQMIVNMQQLHRMCSRYEAMRELVDGKKDIDAECGYPNKVTLAQMDRWYRRGDIAKRVVSVWSDESWLIPPEIYEDEQPEMTKFEEEWKLLDQQLAVLSKLQRADELSGIGWFGVVLLGFDDGEKLDQPVSGITDTSDLDGVSDTASSHKLLYMRTYSQRNVKIKAYETDETSPRYGLPTEYSINQFVDSTDGGENEAVPPATWVTIHWHRIIHLADNRKESEIFGEPRLKTVFDRVYDTRKIYGAAGEGYWKAGVPAYAFSMNPDVKDAKIDVPSVKAQMDMFSNGLQKYLALENMSVNPLESRIQDPNLWSSCEIEAICIAMNIPVPVFKGAVSKDTDVSAWNLRVRSRQLLYNTPFIIRPFFNRCFAAGALTRPENGVTVRWADLNGPSEDQKATIAQKLTQALSQYTGSNAEWLVQPYEFFLYFCGFTEQEAKHLADKVDEQYMQEKNDAALLADQPQPGGGAAPDSKTVTGTKGMGAGGSRSEVARRPRNFPRKTKF